MYVCCDLSSRGHSSGRKHRACFSPHRPGPMASTGRKAWSNGLTVASPFFLTTTCVRRARADNNNKQIRRSIRPMKFTIYDLRQKETKVAMNSRQAMTRIEEESDLVLGQHNDAAYYSPPAQSLSPPPCPWLCRSRHDRLPPMPPHLHCPPPFLAEDFPPTSCGR